MGVHSCSRFEICLHKNVFMAEKVHEIPLPALTLSGFAMCFLRWSHHKSSYRHTHLGVLCVPLLPTSKMVSWPSLHPKRSGTATAGSPPCMEAQCLPGICKLDLYKWPCICGPLCRGTNLNGINLEDGVQKQTPKLLKQTSPAPNNPPPPPLLPPRLNVTFWAHVPNSLEEEHWSWD